MFLIKSLYLRFGVLSLRNSIIISQFSTMALATSYKLMIHFYLREQKHQIMKTEKWYLK